VAVLALGSGLLVGARLAPTSPRVPRLAPLSAASPAAVSQQQPAAEPSAPAWTPLPSANGPFMPTKLVIEKLGVQAPVEIKGVDSHNVMQAPDRPFDVAWYQFTAKPGSGSNAVFAGHKDFSGIGPAIFYHLPDLRVGDAIDVVSGQGTEVRYKVTQSQAYPVSSMPMAQILSASKSDQLTLITCAGAFHNGAYDQRLVVHATKAA
jgi:LPXTG-site transpeptidase (sortase) family protein